MFRNDDHHGMDGELGHTWRQWLHARWRSSGVLMICALFLVTVWISPAQDLAPPMERSTNSEATSSTSQVLLSKPVTVVPRQALVNNLDRKNKSKSLAPPRRTWEFGAPVWMWSDEHHCIFKHRKLRSRLRIFCLGDSITYGNGSHMRLKREPGGNYPLTLQMDRVLRSSFCPWVRIEVRNLGWNGCSAQEGKRCYRNTAIYRAGLRAIKSSADVVVLILGTNDSKEYNWVSQEALESALLGYLEDFEAHRNPVLQSLFILGSPPPVFPNPLHFKVGVKPPAETAYHIHIDRVRHEVRDSVLSVAENAPFPVIPVDFFGEVNRRAAGGLLEEAGRRFEAGDATVDDVQTIRHYYFDGVHLLPPAHQIVSDIVRDVVISSLQRSAQEGRRNSTTDEIG